jgi:cation-transporting ATPase I
MTFLDWFRPVLGLFGSRPRRIHVVNGRAHVELRALTPEQHGPFAERLADALAQLDGVLGVAVNAHLARAVVEFDGTRCDIDAIVALVARTEGECGAEHAPFPTEQAEHPGDLDPLVRALVELGGDVLGFGMAVVGRVSPSRVRAIQIDALAALSFFDVPRLRALLDERLGRQATNLALTLGNSMLQGLAQSPLGPLVDIGYRVLVVSERVAGRRAWAEREADLCAAGAAGAAAEPAREGRPVPLPPGAIEKYADAALVGSLGAFGVGVATTGSVVDATGLLFGGLPKPARLGREAFAAHVARLLAQRKILVLDAEVLRRLDRLDCVVLDGALLAAPDVTAGEVVPVTGVEPTEAHRRIVALLERAGGAAVANDGTWTLAPLGASNGELPAAVSRRVERMRARRHPVLELRCGGTLVAVAEASAPADPDLEGLVASARRAGMRVLVAGTEPVPIEGLAPADVVPPPAFAETVRRLQQEGHVVAAVGGSRLLGLRTADCAIGISRPGGPAPWGAHLLAGRRLDDARFVLDAVVAAREVAQQSVMVAAAGTGVGFLISFGNLSREAAGRVMTAVNVASMVSMANGVRAGIVLGFRPAPVPRDTTPWHSLEADVVLARLGSSLAGLSTVEVARRRVAAALGASWAVRLGQAVVDQLRTPLTPLLGAGAALSAVAGSIADAGLVLGVLGLNAVIGGAERVRADAAIDDLHDSNVARVRVRRDGGQVDVAAGDLVPGDVLRLHAGDVVPADARIVEAQGLEVDEATLTGESLPVAKDPAPSLAVDVAERASMVYRGTSVVAGTATAVVVAVGEATEARRGLHGGEGEKPPSGVEGRLDAITRLTAPAAVLGGLAVAAAGMVRGRPGREALGTGVGLAVAAVPEGLPLLAMIAQLASARRLSRRGALVRNPGAIEALGRVNIVCVDKTGTVTEGRIQLHTVSDGAVEELAPVAGPGARAAIAAALRACPDASRTLAHPTDRALVEGAAALDVGVTTAADGWVRLAELPFEPARGFHAVLGRCGDSLLVSVKGAPEVLLPRSRRWRRDGGTVELDAATRDRLAAEVERLAARGLRVLAVAEKALPLDTPFDDPAVDALDLCGFVAFSDPVRPSAAAAVAGLRAAGIDVVMITGDHPSTAARISAELGLLDGEGVATGAELDDTDDTRLATLVGRVRVFARVTPAHKVRIVRALQRAGRIVAMAGDGANDAPAIRLANVGIALGARATSAARDAADLVVTDDRIETVVDAVLEGRAMWASVRDAVSVLVGGNLGEIGFMVTAGLLGGAPPLNARQLLLVNLLTDVAPAMAIALRPPAPAMPAELLREGPEASLGRALDRDIAWRAVVTASGTGAAWLLARPVGSAARASTVALVSLVGTQLAQTLVAGGQSPLVLAAGLGSFAALTAVVQTPGVSQFFGCVPLGPLGWATALGATGIATAASFVAPRTLAALEEWWTAAGGTRFERVAWVRDLLPAPHGLPAP